MSQGVHEIGGTPFHKGGSGDLTQENFDKLVPQNAF